MSAVSGHPAIGILYSGEQLDLTWALKGNDTTLDFKVICTSQGRYYLHRACNCRSLWFQGKGRDLLALSPHLIFK